MKLRHYTIITLVMFLALCIGTAAQETAQEPKLVEVDLYFRMGDSIVAPAVVENPLDQDVDVTKSVYLSVVRYVDPQTGEAYDKTTPSLGFDINDLKHFFRLEKKEFLLGEPILVEHYIELNGPGKLDWFIGGNYRTRGRDDNFSYVLLSDDGVIVPDVYPKITGFYSAGGLGSDHTVKKGQPLSYWSPLQRYSAITQPGVYHVYCSTGAKQVTFGQVEALRAALPEEVAIDHYIDDSGNLIDKQTQQESKRYELRTNEHRIDTADELPVTKVLPEVIYEFSGKHRAGFSFEQPAFFGTVAHFKITVREGTLAEQEQMIARWTETAGRNPQAKLMGSYESAVLQSIWYAQQDNFLPLIEEWVVKNAGSDEPFPSTPAYLDALAMRPDAAAFRVLLKASPKQITNAFYRLHRDRIAEAVPLCINWLTHANNEVRAMAEGHLGSWTGQSFKRSWQGYDYQRPTPAEGKRMQRLWRAWWEKNKQDFKPHEPCDFPCVAGEKKPDAGL